MDKDSIICYNGKENTIEKWAELYGISCASLLLRLTQGFTFEKALFFQSEKRERLITYKGKTQNLKQWAKELNVPYTTLVNRLNKLHWTVEKALETPFEGLYWNRQKESKND